jgi:hypothetical protein
MWRMRVMLNQFGYPISRTHFSQGERFYVDLLSPETKKRT